jgi:hypothetical protein
MKDLNITEDLSNLAEEVQKNTYDKSLILGIGNFNNYLSDEQLIKLDKLIEDIEKSNTKFDGNIWENELTILYDALCNTPFVDKSIVKFVPVRSNSVLYLQLWDGRSWNISEETDEHCNFNLNPLSDEEKLMYLDMDMVFNTCTYWANFFTRLTKFKSMIQCDNESEFYYIDLYILKTVLIVYFTSVWVWLCDQNAMDYHKSPCWNTSYKKLVEKFPWFNIGSDYSIHYGAISTMPWGDLYLKSY